MHCIRIFQKYVNSFNFNSQTLIMKMIWDKHWKSTKLWTIKKNIKNICLTNKIEELITFVKMKKTTIRNADNNIRKFYWISKMIMKLKKNWNKTKPNWIISYQPAKKVKKIKKKRLYKFKIIKNLNKVIKKHLTSLKRFTKLKSKELDRITIKKSKY
jgi:hypothetical protein